MNIPKMRKEDLPGLSSKKYQIIKIKEGEMLVKEVQEQIGGLCPRPPLTIGPRPLPNPPHDLNDGSLFIVEIGEMNRKFNLTNEKFSIDDIISDNDIREMMM